MEASGGVVSAGHRGQRSAKGTAGSGYLLGDENITVTPLLGLPPGSVLTYNERVSSGWTNTLPGQPAH